MDTRTPTPRLGTQQRTGTPWVGALALALLAGGVAVAQPQNNRIDGRGGSAGPQRNPGDGRALDANLRVGSDGKNEAVRDLNALKRFNDAVIYGQASGGKSFRDTSGGVRDPFEFRSALGTNSQYRFERDTANQSLIASGLRSSDALAYQMALSSGEPVAPPISMALLPYRSERASSGTSLAAMRSLTQFEWEQSRRPSVLGYAGSRTGQTRVLTASPLRGLSASYVVDDAGDVLLSGIERTPATIARVNDLRGTTPGSKPVSRSTTTRVDARVDTRSSAYDEQMKKLREEGGYTDDGAPGQPGGGPGAPGAPGATPGAGTPSKPQWERDLDDLRARLKTRADEAAKAAAGGPAPDAAAQEEKDKADRETRVERMVNVLKRMRAGEPVKNLAGDGQPAPGLYNDVIALGQKLMIDGQYFDAEAVFSRILSAHPDDAMAASGRAHAQIGAGAFVSAASSLRLLFQRHPEVIPTRYTGAAMVPAKRVDEVVVTLSKAAADAESPISGDAGLILAYLGFQRDNTTWLKAGLDALARENPEGAPNHQVVELLREVWTGEAKPLAPLPAPAPAPAPVEAPAQPPAAGTPNK